MLALAIDGAFLLQGINSVMDIIARKLPREAPAESRVGTGFMEDAIKDLQTMEAVLTKAMEARGARQPVPAGLVQAFNVQEIRKLTSSATQLLTTTSETGTYDEEVSENLLLELASFADRLSASDAGLAVVQKLAEQRTSPEAREMCADYVDTLLEGCLGTVQSLAGGLQKSVGTRFALNGQRKPFANRLVEGYLSAAVSLQVHQARTN